MAALHSEKLLDHFQNPRNAGCLPPPALTVEVENPACGDIMRLSAHCIDARIERAGFQTKGCTASIACGSALTELLVGRTVDEAARLTAANIEEAVGGLIPESRHAARLCLDSVQALVKVLRASSGSYPDAGRS